MTLAEIINLHEQRTTAPLRRSAAGALTPKGHATINLYRFVRQLRTLGPDDRACVLALMAAEIRPVIADLAAPVA